MKPSAAARTIDPLGRITVLCDRRNSAGRALAEAATLLGWPVQDLHRDHPYNVAIVRYSLDGDEGEAGIDLEVHRNQVTHSRHRLPQRLTEIAASAESQALVKARAAGLPTTETVFSGNRRLTTHDKDV